MAKINPKHVRALIAQYQVLLEKEEEHGIHDLVKSWFNYLEPAEKTILNKYKTDKSQLELRFDEHFAQFGHEMMIKSVPVGIKKKGQSIQSPA